jgi:hypothetical protein
MYLYFHENTKSIFPTFYLKSFGELKSFEFNIVWCERYKKKKLLVSEKKVQVQILKHV